MSRKQQKRRRESQSHDHHRGSGTEPVRVEEQQLLLALSPENISTEKLMEQICEWTNLCQALDRVKANKGSAGLDRMTVEQLDGWLVKHRENVKAALLDGAYHPKPARGVMIPKPGGGMRQLGIPTVVDRVIQQAILQVLDPILDPTFSQHSYGFRKRCSAHHALKEAARIVKEGRTIVVDIDLEKFFDRVNHDILMGRLARRIQDKRLLKLIRKYLQAGILQNGVRMNRDEGTPQGGPLSPLLANFLLDELDKELERRGHHFCRYADDCNIYVKTETAGMRVMESITRFLKKKLKLKVNQKKSAVSLVSTRKFLGYRIHEDGSLSVAPQSMERVKAKVRKMTHRRAPRALEGTIKNLNQYLTGWIHYFKLSEYKRPLAGLDGWIRRRFRAAKLYQLKRPRTLRRFLESQGISKRASRNIASSGKGKWRLARSNGIHRAMSNAWFKSMGYIELEETWKRINGKLKETAVYGTVRTVV